MKIIVATPIGKASNGLYYEIFPSRWSAATQYHTNTFYPYDLAYLSSLLKRDTDHQVTMIDGNYQGYTIGKYVEILIAERPDLIVMELDSLTYSESVIMLRRVKERIGCRIVLCGPYPTYAPEQALAAVADFVAMGEFQTAIVNLVSNGLGPTIRGIYPNERAELIDVNNLPFPEDDDIQRRDYCRFYGSEYHEVEVFPTKGCPINCNYCVVRNIYHGQGNFRARDVDDVVAEIRQLVEKYPDIDGIFFNEESHTANRHYTRKLCDALIASGLGSRLRFNCMCNYSSLDRSLLELMKQAGYYKVRFGIETLDLENSKQIFTGKWKTDTGKMMEVLEHCRELEIKVYVTLSVGTMGSTEEKDLATLDSVKLLYEQGLLQEYQVSINTPMPGTPFYEMVKEKGYLYTDDITEQNGISGSVVDFPWYSKRQIDRVFSEFVQFRGESIQRNKDRGVRYTMYEEDWVAKVYEMTRISQQYA